jgi:EAL domain-containing protein (putative c-di-GMP-specific phosphodiesterase class I)
MAKRLDLPVVAEGIENIRQMNFFRRESVNLQQGCLFGDRVTTGEFRRMLDKRASPDPLNLVSLSKTTHRRRILSGIYAASEPVAPRQENPHSGFQRAQWA